MKMTLEKAMQRQNDLESLGGLTLPAKLSFAIKRNIDNLRKETERAEEQRMMLCRRYADKDEDGDPIMVDSMNDGVVAKHYLVSNENRGEFIAEYMELMNTEVDVDIRTVTAEQIERCEESERYSIPTVAQLSGMGFMLED